MAVGLNDGPEANAAEAGFNRDCNGCKHEKKFIPACHIVCMTEEILRANSAHYLPLLARIRLWPNAPETLQEIDAEISRLEAGAKGGE